MARAAIQDVIEVDAATEIQLFELASHADLLRTGIVQPPMRDGMFAMERHWRISFSRTSDDGREIAMVKVPAYGEANPTTQLHEYDRQGRPRKVLS